MNTKFFDLHLFILCHQAGLQFLRVSILLQKVQHQLLFQPLLGQKEVLQRQNKRGSRCRTRQRSAQSSPNTDEACRKPRLRTRFKCIIRELEGQRRLKVITFFDYVLKITFFPCLVICQIYSAHKTRFPLSGCQFVNDDLTDYCFVF